MTLTASAPCTAGKNILFGGFTTSVPVGSSGTVDLIQVSSSTFDTSTMTWKVTATNMGNGNGNRNLDLLLTPYAICGMVQP